MQQVQGILAIPGAAMALQLLGSLGAILVLAWLARKLGLGGDPRIKSEDHARALAEEAICGFDAQAVCIDRAGIGALLRDAHDRVLLIRQHGSHFAARQISSHAGVRLDSRFLTIATDDRHFGTVTLDLGDQAQVWAASLRRLGGAPA
ncbi:hypothetical protein [Novosphingobium sp. MMS21-SN21R]|uniref:hypothetical protein n=1 Tax=Novosphingobium sp. MMS21-SN21R TaxID=2969298 RepID=UPI002886BC81|nr:hypothetical protein [Novosphingobium sp. MMS21-SN21R]MDT0506782.1 hypothetical protein [Novosphingobium sp. MMS21-SN21R]